MRTNVISAIAFTFVTITASGCYSFSTTTFASKPTIQTAANLHYHTQFEPLKLSSSSFIAFRLTVTNKTQEPLHVDWNGTRYLYDNKPSGLFVFRGIDPEAVKNETIALETIPPESVLTKVIAPQKYAYAAVRSPRSVSLGQPEIGFGPIPRGPSGILLSIKHNDSVTTETLTVNIGRKKIETKRRHSQTGRPGGGYRPPPTRRR